jgi:hypothetical protein
VLGKFADSTGNTLTFEQRPMKTGNGALVTQKNCEYRKMLEKILEDNDNKVEKAFVKSKIVLTFVW